MADSFIDVKSILDEYSVEIQDALTLEAINIAKKGASELKTNSPKRTGNYAKGWRVTTDKKKGSVDCIIHNGTNWQLTHLLEKPHLLRNGSLSTPKVHIKPVEEKCIAEYETNVAKIIENGV